MRTRAAVRPSRRFEDHLHAFVEDLRVKRHARSSMKRALYSLPRFFVYLKGERIRDVRSVTEAHVTAYARRLQATRVMRTGELLRPMTRRVYLHDVRRFFVFLFQRGVILRNPAADLPLPKPLYLPRTVLTPRQAEKLMNEPARWSRCEQRDWALLEVLYGTGIRRGECMRLDVTDVDLQRRTLVVRDSKGKRDRLIPLPGRAAIALDRYLRESRPRMVRDPREQALFLSYTFSRGRRLCANGINEVVAKRARQAKIPHRVFPHALRHTCATHLLQGGADLKHAQELLGHRRITSTATYTRVGVQDLLKVFERAHPRERRRRR